MDKTAQSWDAYKVVGVDIDETLIRAAWRRRRTVWSLQAPRTEQNNANQGEGSEIQKKRKHDTQAPYAEYQGIKNSPDYFPASCEHSFGPLPIPPAENRGQNSFPHNVSFRCADWVESEIPEDSGGYDIVIA
jgi:hypothetical protein